MLGFHSWWGEGISNPLLKLHAFREPLLRQTHDNEQEERRSLNNNIKIIIIKDNLMEQWGNYHLACY